MTPAATAAAIALGKRTREKIRREKERRSGRQETKPNQWRREKGKENRKTRLAILKLDGRGMDE